MAKVPELVSQNAAQKVEDEMMEFLLQFHPVGSLTVDDVKTIARFAREATFRTYENLYIHE